MNDCYSKLKELVPSIPQNKSVSQVEILQHVIDYIFDLQIALEAEDAAAPEMVLSIKVRGDAGCRVEGCFFDQLISPLRNIISVNLAEWMVNLCA